MDCICNVAGREIHCPLHGDKPGLNPAKVVFDTVENKISMTPSEFAAKAKEVGHDSFGCLVEETFNIPDVPFSDFEKLDIRTATIVSAERIPKKDRLLKLEVSLGEMGKRTIVAGIAENYPPEHLPGTKIVMITNLEPRKVGGIESHGMILAAKEGASLALVSLSLELSDGIKIG